METGHVIECRSCGRRHGLHLAVHQQELAQVGMLEQHCFSCAKIAMWQLVAQARKDDRRAQERRDRDRRQQMLQAPLIGRERRASRDRRTGPVRKTERRAGAA